MNITARHISCKTYNPAKQYHSYKCMPYKNKP